jgi:hypothetical protein
MSKESVDFHKFVLGAEGRTAQFPYDIGSLSIEELMELGFEVVGNTEVRLNDAGEMVTDGPIDENILKELKAM